MSTCRRFSEAGGPEVLKFRDIDVPDAGPGQVRIRVKAIGLNRAESMWRQNKYIEPVQFPLGLAMKRWVPWDSVGKDVTTIAVGDEVNTIPSFSMNQYGMYGEVVLAPIHAVVKHPKGLSPVEAASIWMMFITAYGALIEDAKITSQDAVVIPGASSSVGLAAIQIANSVGAKSVALTVQCEAKAAHGRRRQVCHRDRGRGFGRTINEISGGQAPVSCSIRSAGRRSRSLSKQLRFRGFFICMAR